MSERQQRNAVQEVMAQAPAWSVRDAKPDDAPFITRMWDKYFGGFDDTPGVVKLGTDPDDEYNYCNVAVADGQLVGCGITSVGPLEHIDQCVGIGLIDEFCSEGNGFLHLGAVKTAYRNRGIGTALMRHRLGWLTGAGAKKVFGMAWVRDDAPDSRPVFGECGFEQIRYIDGYYRQYGTRENCPDCGVECECDAVLYGRELP